MCYSNHCDKRNERLESICLLLLGVSGRTKATGLRLKILTFQASKWRRFDQVHEESSGEERHLCFWTFAGLSIPYVQTYVTEDALSPVPCPQCSAPSFPSPVPYPKQLWRFEHSGLRTRNCRQGSGGQGVGDRNLGQGTADRALGTGGLGQGTGGRELGAANWGQGTGDRELWMEVCSEQTAFKPNVCGGANKLLPLRGAVCGGFGGTRIRCPSVEVELRSLRRGIFFCEIHSFLRSSIGASVRGVVFLVYCGADKVLPLRGAVCGGFG